MCESKTEPSNFSFIFQSFKTHCWDENSYSAVLGVLLRVQLPYDPGWRIFQWRLYLPLKVGFPLQSLLQKMESVFCLSQAFTHFPLLRRVASLSLLRSVACLLIMMIARLLFKSEAFARWNFRVLSSRKCLKSKSVTWNDDTCSSSGESLSR